jgi:O-antigen ligase
MLQTNKSIRIGAGTAMPSLLFGLCAFAMICSVALGGGAQRGHIGDVVLQFVSLPLLLASLWRIVELRSGAAANSRPFRWELVFCGAIVLVPLVQLIPLPPSIWSALPNRTPQAFVFGLLGGEKPWMPISVSSEMTWLSALSLLPPIAIFLGCLLLNYRERRLMSLVVLAMALVSAFVGLIQFSQGPSSAWRFLATNSSEAEGFFGDRDHLAALLYTSTLLAAAWAIDATFTAQSRGGRFDAVTIVTLLASFTTLVILVAGEAMARSRAGLGLTIVALLGIFALAYFDRRARPRAGRRRSSGVTPARLLLGAAIVVTVFIVQFSLYRVMDRFGADPMQDGRITFARNTIEAAKAYMPFGSGMGTFVPVYAMYEKPQDGLAGAYVNRAHDDFLEVSLESGIVGIILIGLFVVWWVLRSTKIWRRAAPPGALEIDVSLARAGTLIVGLLMAHSVVDYPLRTAAMMAIMAFACALLVDPVAGAESEPPIESHEAEARGRPRQRVARQSAPAAAVPSRSRPQPVPSGVAARPATSLPEERAEEGMLWPEEWRSRNRSSKPE